MPDLDPQPEPDAAPAQIPDPAPDATPPVAPVQPVARPSGPAHALLLHASLSKRTDIQGHTIELNAIARRYLGLAPGSAVRVWSSTHDNVWKYMRLLPSEELLFPDGHPLGKQPRYRWFKESPMILVGYLKPEAVAETLDRNTQAPLSPPEPSSIEIES